MRFLIFGDLHIADKAPAGRVDDYMETVLGKLDSIAALCKKYKAEFAVSLGDVYHITVKANDKAGGAAAGLAIKTELRTRQDRGAESIDRPGK